MRKTPVLFYIIWMWDGMEVFFVKNAGVFKIPSLTVKQHKTPLKA